MIQTPEAMYYHIQGLATLTDDDINSIKSQIQEIEKNQDESRYLVAQELYDFYIYLLHRMKHRKTLHFEQGETGRFLGKLSLTNEWDTVHVYHNDMMLYDEAYIKTGVNGEHTREAKVQLEKVMSILQTFEEFTGREYVLPMLTDKFTQYYFISQKAIAQLEDAKFKNRLNFEQLYEPLGASLSGEEAYGTTAWNLIYTAKEQAKRKPLKYNHKLVTEMDKRKFYTSTMMIQAYKQGVFEEHSEDYLELILEGMAYNTRLRTLTIGVT